MIGRQYGSGGRAIGKKLAEQLGFAFYDKDIIQMAAGTTGYDAEYVSENEEIMAHGLLYDLLHQVYVYPDEKAPRDNIFAAESEADRRDRSEGKRRYRGTVRRLYPAGKGKLHQRIFVRTDGFSSKAGHGDGASVRAAGASEDPAGGPPSCRSLPVLHQSDLGHGGQLPSLHRYVAGI